jgi:hypothetical protein
MRASAWVLSAVCALAQSSSSQILSALVAGAQRRKKHLRIGRTGFGLHAYDPVRRGEINPAKQHVLCVDAAGG